MIHFTYNFFNLHWVNRLISPCNVGEFCFSSCKFLLLQEASTPKRNFTGEKTKLIYITVGKDSFTLIINVDNPPHIRHNIVIKFMAQYIFI
jgi:hypothetical protein